MVMPPNESPPRAENPPPVESPAPAENAPRADSPPPSESNPRAESPPPAEDIPPRDSPPLRKMTSQEVKGMKQEMADVEAMFKAARLTREKLPLWRDLTRLSDQFKDLQSRGLILRDNELP
jgi:hypothetical protein